MWIVHLIQRLALAAAIPFALAGCASSHATAAAPTASPVPVVSGVPQPNKACVPADRSAVDAASNDLSGRLLFGYVDGTQKEMLLGDALMQQVNGHKVEYAWLCPLRSQWH